jgi:O-antigen/teichoic acid export membrane protein
VTESSPPRHASLGASLLSGALWSVAIRWVGRVLGFVSLAICARVLTPADYGLVNMAMVVVGFFNIFTHFGIDAALLRNQHCTTADYDTAWTLKVLQGLILGVLIAAAAPWTNELYGDDRIAPIVLSIAACIAFNGFANIYIVDFRKNLDFRTDFILNIVPRLISVGLAIGLALTLRNYWALVVSICSTYVVWVVFSYVMTTKRPRWSLSQSRSLLSFSAWYFAQGLADFVLGQADRMLLGERLGARNMGVYSMARETATLPNTEVTLPLGRALLPTLARINHDGQRFAAAARNTLGAVVTVIAPVSVMLAMVADDFVRVLLGPQWSDAAPLVAIFAVAGTFGAIRIVTTNVMTSMGMVRISACYAWLHAALFIGLLLPVFTAAGLKAVGWLSLAVSMAMVAVHAYALRLIGVFSRLSELGFMARPFAAAALMATGMSLLPELPDMPPLARLILNCSVGSVVYLAATTMMVTRIPIEASHERMLLGLLVPTRLGSMLPDFVGRRLRAFASSGGTK